MSSVGATHINTRLWMYALFAIFAIHGPSVRLFGELRYTEVILIGLLALSAKKAVRWTHTWEKRFVSLFLLAAFMQLISDLLTDARVEGTVRRAGTYVVLALLIPSVRLLVRDDPRRLVAILLGYCASYIVLLYVGQTASANYALVPWRLGLGAAVTLTVCLLPFWKSRFHAISALMLIILAGYHWYEGGRSLSAITAFAGLMVAMTFRMGRSTPSKGSVAKVMYLVIGLIAAFALLEPTLRAITEAGLWSPEMQFKMELQLNSPFGLIGGGRGDTVTALYAIWKSPWLGHGSTNVDPEVLEFYKSLKFATLVNIWSYEDAIQLAYSREWNLGTPSHSHVFGAWADAGVLASLCWWLYLFVSFQVLQRSFLWCHPYQPLFVTVSLFCIWEVLFSPGPIRVDVALKLTVLLFALRFMNRYQSRSH